MIPSSIGQRNGPDRRGPGVRHPFVKTDHRSSVASDGYVRLYATRWSRSINSTSNTIRVYMSPSCVTRSQSLATTSRFGTTTGVPSVPAIRYATASSPRRHRFFQWTSILKSASPVKGVLTTSIDVEMSVTPFHDAMYRRFDARPSVASSSTRVRWSQELGARIKNGVNEIRIGIPRRCQDGRENSFSGVTTTITGPGIDVHEGSEPARLFRLRFIEWLRGLDPERPANDRL